MGGDPVTPVRNCDAAKFLVDFILNQDNHLVTELGTSLIGIGALFFAYASLSTSPYQTVIAFVGLGGSAVLLLHCVGANSERKAAFRALAELSDDSHIGFRLLRKHGDWRDHGLGRLYVPITAAIPWFMGWVVFAWGWILIHSLTPFSLPSWGYVALVTVAIGATYGILQESARRRRRLRRAEIFPKPQTPAVATSSSASSTKWARRGALIAGIEGAALAVLAIFLLLSRLHLL